ncbi:polyprenyl synthetase family protein [Gottfriedia acidiceleris]
MNTFKDFMEYSSRLVNDEMIKSVERLKAPEKLKESMSYSLQGGGKRIRPLLLFATLDAFGNDPLIGIKPACALEMIHTYSLIHDDLPCMDDDDFRRGKPTNHKVFGEDLAVLAGDGLLTYAFKLITEMNVFHVSDQVKLQLISELAIAAGPEGMVAGQVADMEGESKELSGEELQYIHERKTGKMLMYPVIAGAIISKATAEQLSHLTQFAYKLGIAFQIQDDILDVIGDEEVLGKPVGSDVENDKTTYVKLYSVEGAKERLHTFITEAKQHVRACGIKDDYLISICDFVENRSF